MTSTRILHVDDEPDIREVVEVSLGLDPEFAVQSCASGDVAIAVAADWQPNMILLDVMMPAMGGPTPTHLRDNPLTSYISVVFAPCRLRLWSQLGRGHVDMIATVAANLDLCSYDGQTENL